MTSIDALNLFPLCCRLLSLTVLPFLPVTVSVFACTSTACSCLATLPPKVHFHHSAELALWLMPARWPLCTSVLSSHSYAGHRSRRCSASSVSAPQRRQNRSSRRTGTCLPLTDTLSQRPVSILSSRQPVLIFVHNLLVVLFLDSKYSSRSMVFFHRA